MLPDNALLEIFDLYRDEYPRPPLIWKWLLLVHVCRKWRQIVFASPRRLNLQIICRDGTPVRKNLGIWPAIPIVVRYGHYRRAITPDEEDNAIAALEHSDRVCRVVLHVTGSQLGKIATVMQEPFPVLTHFSISTKDINVPVIPGGFLGGSAPCLQEIELCGVPFPALPTLLVSASDLVELKLRKIPPTGYVPPMAMVARLAALPKLKSFRIEFQLTTPRPDRMHLLPVTRTVLPALTNFVFSGACEYLEDLVARIDAPRLVWLGIHYLNQVVDFEVPQLSRFIDRSENLKRSLSRCCEVTLDRGGVDFCIGGATSDETKRWDRGTGISVRIVCQGIDWQISHITHALGWISTIVSDIVHFAIDSQPFKSESEAMDDIEWLQLLRPFSSVQTLFVYRQLAGHVSHALEDIAGVMIIEVLPALTLLYLQDQPMSSVGKFIAARRNSGHPVGIVDSKGEFEQRLWSYP